MFSKLYDLNSKRNQWMVVVFACYIFFVFIFGGVYYLIHKSNRQAFSFNVDIVLSQSRTVELEMLPLIQKLDSELIVLRQMQRELSTIQYEPTLRTVSAGILTPVKRESTIKVSDASFTVIWSDARGGFPPPPSNPPTKLVVASQDGAHQITIVGEPHYKLPETLADYRTLCDKWIDDWESRTAQLQRILNTLTTASPDVWSYWDFLYFSAITQFTVGYGDILPNSTSVRLVVVSQSSIAVLLIVLVINLAFRSNTN